MSGAEHAPIVRTAVMGAACGLSLVFGAYQLAGHLRDRLVAAIPPRSTTP